MVYLFLAMSLFLAPTDPQLNEKAYDVCPCHILSEETQEIIDTMYKIALGETEDANRAILVGLSAPQIGIQKRIILVDLAATGVFTAEIHPPPPQMKEFINPEILWKSETTTIWREGCFSTDRICGLVPRSTDILVRAYDRQGNIFTQEFTGYTARIFQHEIDHLDGIRFPERIQNENDLHWVESSEVPEYRIHWASWEKKCPRIDWERMKNGHIQ